MKKILTTLGFFSAAVLSAQNTAAPAAASGTTAATAATSAPLLGQRANALPVNPNLPTLWLIGDSTVHNGTGYGGVDGQWGWGAPLEYYFDLGKINVVNRAVGGTSSRSFYTGQWSRVVSNIKKGDIVIMQFGANDNGTPTTTQTALRGNGDETQEITNRAGQPEIVHTFGWYMTQYVKETREKGAIPIICSLTPRNGWTADGKFQRSVGTHVAWAATTAETTHTPYINLYELIALKSEEVGKDKTATYYGPTPTEHLHTVWYGAVVNAECVVSGLKALKDDPLVAFLSERGKAIPATDAKNVANNFAAAAVTK